MRTLLGIWGIHKLEKVYKSAAVFLAEVLESLAEQLHSFAVTGDEDAQEGGPAPEKRAGQHEDVFLSVQQFA